MKRYGVILFMVGAICGIAWAADQDPGGTQAGGGKGKKVTDELAVGASTTSLSTPGSLPPGLNKKGKTPKGLEKKDKTPAGWSKGKKSGWSRSASTPKGRVKSH